MSGTAPTERINLIMAGGGVRLPAYVGALAALEEMGVEILGVAGASGGSIVGSFLAAGWTVPATYQKLLDTDFTDFKDFTLRGLLLEGGVYSGDSFEQWLDEALGGARFRDLPRALYVSAVDLIGRQPFFFSKRTTPDVPVSKAVRCSMSIPWVWRPQRWGQKLLVDGQLLPWIPAGAEMMQSAHGAGARTVMLRMASDTGERLPPNKKHLWPWDFAKILIETMLAALENQRVPGALWQDTILIQTTGVGTLQLTLTHAEKEALYQTGYEQTKRYFRKRPAAGVA